MAHFYHSFRDGEDIEALVARIMGTPATLAQRAREMLKSQ
jgi:hypothetical protein